MGKNGFIVFAFVSILVSSTCSAFIVFHHRELVTNEPANASTNSSVPAGSPTHELNKVPIISGEPEQTKDKDPHKDNQKDNKPLPFDSKNPTKSSTDLNPSTGKKNTHKVDERHEKAKDQTVQKLDNNDNCEGSLSKCRAQEMVACIKASKNGALELFLVVQNEGKSNLTVHVNSSDYLKTPLISEVPKQKARMMKLPSIVGKKTKLYVSSEKGPCVLLVGNRISTDNLIQQLSFYSKQVTPIYAVYGSFLLVLLFGGTLACCKLRKRNRGDGVPYQELEMGLPESTATGATVDAAEGWYDDWDDNDWDEKTAVRSPAGHQVRNVSADGLTSRSSKKDGWENDWED